MVDLDSDLEENNSGDSSDDFIVSDSDEDFDMGKSKAATKKKATKPAFGSNDDLPNAAAKKAKKLPTNNMSSDDLFDSLIGSPPKKKENDQPKPTSSSHDVYDLGESILFYLLIDCNFKLFVQ